LKWSVAQKNCARLKNVPGPGTFLSGPHFEKSEPLFEKSEPLFEKSESLFQQNNLFWFSPCHWSLIIHHSLFVRFFSDKIRERNL